MKTKYRVIRHIADNTELDFLQFFTIKTIYPNFIQRLFGYTQYNISTWCYVPDPTYSYKDGKYIYINQCDNRFKKWRRYFSRLAGLTSPFDYFVNKYPDIDIFFQERQELYRIYFLNDKQEVVKEYP